LAQSQNTSKQSAWEEELEFSAFIEKLAASLDELYAKDIPEEDKLRLRQGVFARAKEEWSEWITQHPTHRFRYFAQQPLNNAVIIHYWLYLKNLKLFEALYEAEGKNLVQTIDSIREGVAKGGEPFEAVQTLLSKRNNQAVVKSRVVE
jgi:predicted aminopeptidase